MAKDDDLFSWNRPVPRSSVAGDNLGQAAKIIQTRLQSSDSFRTDTRVVGGATVKVHTNQGMPWVEATAPTSKPVFKSCPRSDWGFIDTTNSQEPSAFLGEDPVMGSGPINKLIDAEGNRKQAKLLKNSSDQKSLIYTMLPSLYTGAMRWVMQVMIGTGLKNLESTNLVAYDSATGDYVPLVSAQWSRSCGLFIGESAGGQPTRYLIEVSASGVYRVPITFCSTLPDNWQASQDAALLESAADWNSTHRAIAKYWTVLEVSWGNAVLIGDAPSMYTDHYPLYSDCGWAFDSRGRNAVNTGYRIDPSDPLNSRKICALFQLEITQDGDGVPIAATSYETESDYLMNPVRDDWTGGDKAILQVASAPGVCQTFSCWPGFSNFGNATLTDTPVFAYYDQADTLQVARYRYKAPSAPETVTYGSNGTYSIVGVDPQMGGHLSGFQISHLNRGAGRIMSMPPAWGTSNRTYGLGGSATPTFDTLAGAYAGESYSASRSDGYYAADGPTSYANQLSFSVTQFGYLAGYDACGQHGHVDRATWYGNPYDRWGIRCLATGVTKSTITSSETNTVYEALILHGYDRTSYVHFHYDGNAVRSRSKTRIGAPFVQGVNDPEIDASTVGTSWASWSDQGNYTAPENWPCVPGTLSTQHYQCAYVYNTTAGELIPAHDQTTTGFGPVPAVISSEPDQYTDNVTMTLVIGNQQFTLDGEQFLTDGNSVTDLYLDGATFTYTACGSGFVPTRVAYDTYINATSVAAGFNYAACAGRLHAFAGVF
jgi:hypothetical protein